MIAEESTAWPMVSRPTDMGGLGFGLKWNMGWMHDTLAYMQQDPVYRKYHHGELTFSLIYAFNENFVLPLSHDEVVYGKGSLIGKMPGDDWQKFANLRALYGYMWAHPGKKLLFMGGEFGQRREWTHEGELEWWVTEPARSTPACKRLIGDLNRVYRRESALHQIDFSPDGFEWVDVDNADDERHRLFAQVGGGGAPLLVVCNFTPGAARQFSDRRADARHLARDHQHRCPGLWRLRLGQPGRRRVRARGFARPRRVDQPDSAAALDPRAALGTPWLVPSAKRRQKCEAPERTAAAAHRGGQGTRRHRCAAADCRWRTLCRQAHCGRGGCRRSTLLHGWPRQDARGAALADAGLRPDAHYEINMSRLSQRCVDGANSRHRRRDATGTRSWPGWITSNPGGGNLKGARIRRHSGGAAGRRRAHCRGAGARHRQRCRHSHRVVRAAARIALRTRAAEIAAERALALDPARAHIVARYADRESGRQPDPRNSWSIASARRSAAGMNCFHARLPAQRGLHGTFTDVEARLPYLAEMGFDVLYFPPIHPIGRINRKGTNNRLRARPERCRQSLGDRLGRGRPQGHSAGAGHASMTSSACLNAARGSGHRDRAGPRVSVRARPPLRERASAMVQASPRWQRAIRRESAQEVPGHLSVRFRKRSDWRGLWNELKSVVDFWIAPGREDLSRRQSAHQGVRLLGVADRRDQARPSGCHLSRRGVHPAQGHAPAGQARVHAVVHLFHLAQHQAGADGVFHRADAQAPGRAVLPPQRLAEHAGHPARDAAVGLAPGVRREVDSCRDACPPITASTARRTN